jgi:GxxExxY protein
MEYDDEHSARGEPDPEANYWAKQVIGAAIEVHKQLGAGLNEKIYHRAMCVELRLREIPFEYEVRVNVKYKGEHVGDQRIDLVVAGKLIVELKAVDCFAPIHMAQVITYLKLTKYTLGLLIKFNQLLLKTGIKRIINS